jgi:hypothetical protein
MYNQRLLQIVANLYQAVPYLRLRVIPTGQADIPHCLREVLLILLKLAGRHVERPDSPARSMLNLANCEW